MSIGKIGDDVLGLSQKLEKIDEKLDLLIKNISLVLLAIEATSAKTIADVSKNLSERIELCKCKSKASEFSSFKGLNYYSPPSVVETIGNKELVKSRKEITVKLINEPAQ